MPEIFTVIAAWQHGKQKKTCNRLLINEVYFYLAYLARVMH